LPTGLRLAGVVTLDSHRILLCPANVYEGL
jgi:hypothetical protein